MNDEELVDAWMLIGPTPGASGRINARVAAWLEAYDTPLAAEWLGLFTIAPLASLGLIAVSAVALLTATPVLWIARALL